MSTNCNYVYVQGLRFRTQDVSVVWKGSDGVERLVALRKNGTGRTRFDAAGVPFNVTPKDLAGIVARGETIDVLVRATDPTTRGGVDVRLALDPRAAEGRRGRASFDPSRLVGLEPPHARLFALEQLRTAPYGEENRRQAVDRMLWSIGQLGDRDVASMLSLFDVDESLTLSPEARDVVAAARLARRAAERSSTPVELASLLLSDDRLVAALMRAGMHSSLSRVAGLSTTAASLLVGGASRPASEVFDRVARRALLKGDDSSFKASAVRYVRDPQLLERVLRDSDWRFGQIVRLAAVDAYAIHAADPAPVFAELLQVVTDHEIKVAILSKVHDQQVLASVASSDRSYAVRDAAVGRLTDEGLLADLAAGALADRTTYSEYDYDEPGDTDDPEVLFDALLGRMAQDAASRAAAEREAHSALRALDRLTDPLRVADVLDRRAPGPVALDVRARLVGLSPKVRGESAAARVAVSLVRSLAGADELGQQEVATVRQTVADLLARVVDSGVRADVAEQLQQIASTARQRDVVENVLASLRV